MKTVSFMSNPDAWEAEKNLVNCTVRFVDKFDARFVDLMQSKVTHVQIVNTETKESFTRELIAYQEFEITVGIWAGFDRASPGTDSSIKIIMAKIVWKPFPRYF